MTPAQGALASISRAVRRGRIAVSTLETAWCTSVTSAARMAAEIRGRDSMSRAARGGGTPGSMLKSVWWTSIPSVAHTTLASGGRGGASCMMSPLLAAVIRAISWEARWSTSKRSARPCVVRKSRDGDSTGSNLPTALSTAPSGRIYFVVWCGQHKGGFRPYPLVPGREGILFRVKAECLF